MDTRVAMNLPSPKTASPTGDYRSRDSFPLRTTSNLAHPLPSVTLGGDNAHPGSGQVSSRQSVGSSFMLESRDHSQRNSRDLETPEPTRDRDSDTLPVTREIPYRQRQVEIGSGGARRVSQSAHIALSAEIETYEEEDGAEANDEPAPQLQYFHRPFETSRQSPTTRPHVQSPSASSHSSDQTTGRDGLQTPGNGSRATLGHELRGRTNSPHLSVYDSPGASPVHYARSVSANRRSPDNRPQSYVDLLNVPYSQQVAPTSGLGNSGLRNVVGTNASLLDSKKTLDLYRANLKKTTEPSVAYEFAVYMVGIAQGIKNDGESAENAGINPAELLKEAQVALQRLADKSYPFAQYYLGDGFSSGLFNKEKPDHSRAFALFVAASKHGHAEAGYRAALCYEYGWGCRRDYQKAVQFYRASASKAHPGAASRLGVACVRKELGLENNYREGLKWLKRGVDNADAQYNSAPYELGLLHETGFGADCFKDEAYSAQLFTHSAELGHVEAARRMGEAYEHGLLNCPKDPALSVHFYNTAAQGGSPEAMMNLCAWYMVGAEPILDKDENEAYEWAKRAGDLDLAKAQYACGYFMEMGIGCRRDPLEANVWYVKAADQGDERAKQRLETIREAASGGPSTQEKPGKGPKSPKNKDKDCIMM